MTIEIVTYAISIISIVIYICFQLYYFTYSKKQLSKYKGTKEYKTRFISIKQNIKASNILLTFIIPYINIVAISVLITCVLIAVFTNFFTSVIPRYYEKFIEWWFDFKL